jgi:ABC-type protease/lipase transport system fused ATPase/permease subunit
MELAEGMMNNGDNSSSVKTELERAFDSCRDIFALVLIFSLFANLLLFVSPLYLLQVYDRVLTTHSFETLLMLTAIAIVALAVMGVLELTRSRLLIRAGVRLDTALADRVFAAIFRSSVERRTSIGTQPLRDLTTLREFLSGGGVIVFCDAPWVPIFILALFMRHSALGLVSVGGAV